MAQIVPISVLPQSTFVEYVPLASQNIDISNVLNTTMNYERVAEEKKRYRDTQLDKATQTFIKSQETLANLNMSADNPYQANIVKNLEAKVNPFYKELEYSLTSGEDGGLDSGLFNKVLIDISKAYADPQVMAALRNNKRHATLLDQVSKRKDIDEEFLNDYLASYHSWDGQGTDPTMTNVNNLTAFDIDRYNKRLTDYFKGTPTTIIQNGMEVKGEILPDITDKLSAEWDRNSRHLSRLFNTKEDYLRSELQNYFAGAQQLTEGAFKDQFFRVTDVGNLGTSQGSGSSSGTGSSVTAVNADNLLHTLPDGKSITYNADGSLVLPTSKENNDGYLALNEADITKTLMNPGSILMDLNESKNQKQDEYDNIDKLQKELIKSGKAKISNGVYTFPNTPEGRKAREEYNQNTERIKELGHSIRQFDSEISKVKDNEYFKSDEYKKSEKEKLKIKSIYRSGSSVTPGGSTVIDSISDNFGGDLKGIWNILSKEEQNKLEQTKTVEDRLTFLNKMLTKYPKIKNDLDRYKERSLEKESELYNNYAAKTGLLESTYNEKGFEFIMNDIDNQSLLQNYLKNYTDVSLRGKDVRYFDGKSYKGDANHRLIPQNIMFDNNTGKYALKALVGEPERDEDDKPILDKHEIPTIKNGKEVIIQDSNINTKTISYNMLDMNFSLPIAQFNGTTAEATKLTEGILEKIGKDTKNRKGLSTSINLAGVTYSIKNLGDNKYQVTSSGLIGEQLNTTIDGLMNLSKSIYKNYKVDLYNKAIASFQNTISTQGGGNVGKSQGVQQAPSNLMEAMAVGAETKGHKSPYTAVNPDTNALGKYQFTPRNYGLKILSYVEKNIGNYLTKEQQEKYANMSSKDIEGLRKKYGLSSGYNEDSVALYSLFLESSKLQDDFAQHIYKNEYTAQIPKVIEAFKKKGKNLNETEALDILHHYGSTNALKGIGEPREWTKGQNTFNTSNYKIKAFDPGISFKNTQPGVEDGIKTLLFKAGFDDLDYKISSTYRSNSKTGHGKGLGVDIKINNPQDEAKALQRIANLTNDPQSALQAFANCKGTNGAGCKGVTLNVPSLGKKMFIIFHGDSDKSGNHLDIKFSNI